MKRFLLYTLVIGLFAVQANAALWVLDEPTALTFTSFTMNQGTVTLDTLSMYDSPTNKVFGPGPAVYGTMSGQVGFAATVTGDDPDGDLIGYAEMEIYNPAPALSDATLYDGITAYFENDDQSHWAFQLFYEIDSVEYASDWGHLDPHLSMNLTTGAPVGGLNLGDIDLIGFRVLGHEMGGPNLFEPSLTDTFHVSVVPVPAGVILGVLGLGVVGWKLRRFA